MKLLLFLGSGISLPSGIPAVDKIADSVLNGTWFQHTDGRFIQGTRDSLRPSPVPALQQFLHRLKPNADRANSLTSDPAGSGANYEDLSYLAEQIADNARDLVDNPAIYPFETELKKQMHDLTDALHISIGELASLACDFIRSVVHQCIAIPVQIKGLDLVQSLASSADVQALDIVTLNHDLLIERLLDEASIPYVDGFGDLEGDVRYFAPSVYAAPVKIRLFKLHGSINWFRFRSDRENPFSDRYAIAADGDPSHCRDRNGKILDNLDVIPWILAGTHTKPVQYNFGIFAEMFFWFHKLLKEHDLIAMSGYGWNDRGINGRLMEWLYSSRPTTLFLMHKTPSELAQYSRSPLWRSYQSLVRSNRIVPITKWMQDVTLRELLAKIGEVRKRQEEFRRATAERHDYPN